MKIDVREIEAGPELDAACAEARGLEVLTRPGKYDLSGLEYRTRWFKEGRDAPMRRYSRDIAAAWVLVDAMHVDGVDGPSVGYRGYDDKHWCAVWKNGEMDFHKGTIAAYANTTSLAICRAFLLAHGVTELEVNNEPD